MKLNKKQQEIYNQRSQLYGDAISGHKNLGLIWTGILQHWSGMSFKNPIPPHIVSLMLAVNKINRIADNEYLEDNYLDAVIYLKIAEDCQLNSEKDSTK